MRLLDLPQWLETWDLAYKTVPGWETAGKPFADAAPPIVVLGHHTATSLRSTGDMPTLKMLCQGRSDLPGPLSQVGLGRSGLVYVIASGKANHAGAGRWRGLPGGREYDVELSSRTVGIEAEHPGDSSPWPAVQLAAYDRLIACLLWGLNQDAEAYCGHREWALPSGRKPDPHGIDLPQQRTRVGRLLAAGPTTTSQEDDVLGAYVFNNRGTTYLRDGGDTIAIPDWDDALKYIKAGARDLTKLSDKMTDLLIKAANQ